MDFYTVLESAAQINESVIGYRITAFENNSDEHFGVYINPDKSKKVTFSENDFIIVLAED